MARIDSFNSGFIVVDGKQYLHDVVILPDGSVTPREGGKGRLGSHAITWQDVAGIDRERPDFVVIGTGAKGRARVTVDAEMNLRQDRINLDILTSFQAVDRFNQLAGEGKRVAALIHITC